MSYYLIRVGEGSKYLAEAIKKGFIAIGWNDTGDLTRYVEFKDLKQRFIDTHTLRLFCWSSYFTSQ